MKTRLVKDWPDGTKAFCALALDSMVTLKIAEREMDMMMPLKNIAFVAFIILMFV